VVYDLEDFAIFDRLVPSFTDQPELPAVVRGMTLGETLMLESARLADTSLRRGDTLHIALVWQPQQADATNYKTFVHLADESGRPVAQWDGYPCFNTARTSQWAVGEPVEDHVLLKIPEDVAPGTYSLLVGFYDESTGDRLGDQAIQLGAITLR
jgi:hypothetical protein